MKELRLRTAAVTGALLSLAATGVLLLSDWHLGLTLLGVLFAIVGGASAVMRCEQESQRLTRQAVFQQRRWTDRPEDYENVVNLR